jgi:hypothetical protein
MTQSLCESCVRMREVISAKGSRFLLCRLAQSNPAYPKYPPQPVVRCPGFEAIVAQEEPKPCPEK